jgi:predicted DNA-binding transcriptional regulator AlpA
MNQDPPVESNVTTLSVELWDLKTVLAYIGGSRPIAASTLYRGITAGRYPKPLKIGPKLNRWSRTECEATLRRLAAQREQAA